MRACKRMPVNSLMGGSRLYSRGTKELLAELEISDELLEWLKKQKDPSQTFENMIKSLMESEIKKLSGKNEETKKDSN